MRKIKVALIGLGTVGTGVAKTLLEKKTLLQERIGQPVVLHRVCDRHFRRAAEIRLPKQLQTKHADDILNDAEVQIVIELIGGIEPARSLILKAIRKGKHVVTANKALLATSGGELFKEAQEANVNLYFEAAVAGGIPIVKALREGLLSNRFDTILGIVNGTSNYILTQMRQQGWSFRQALQEAKEKGYAEQDPSLDINGYDASHKLAILARLGFGADISLKNIPVDGIKNLSQADIQYADELGYCIKPLAIAKQVGKDLDVRVHPTLLGRNHLLAKVDGVYNALYVHGDQIGTSLFYGRGAGRMPTSSAVIGDIADACWDVSRGTRSRIPFIQKRTTTFTRLREIGHITTRYYMRFTVKDHPGVLSKIAGVLGRHSISIASVHQKECETSRIVPVVMMTHEALEKNVRKALAHIDKLSFVKQPTVSIRTEAPRQR